MCLYFQKRTQVFVRGEKKHFIVYKQNFTQKGLRAYLSKVKGAFNSPLGPLSSKSKKV